MPDYQIYENTPGVFAVMKRYGQSSFYDLVYSTTTLDAAVAYINNAPWPKVYDSTGTPVA